MKNNVVEINNLIKEVRNSKYNKKANVYDYFGNLKNKIPIILEKAKVPIK